MQWKPFFIVFIFLLALFINNHAEGRRKSSKKDVCRLPKVVGPCYALIKRYYFKKETGKCRSFYYGGCGGNGNNFKSRSSCRKRCEKKKND